MVVDMRKVDGVFPDPPLMNWSQGKVTSELLAHSHSHIWNFVAVGFILIRGCINCGHVEQTIPGNDGEWHPITWKPDWLIK